MGKIFWFDCETTGLNPKRNAIIEMGVLIEIDGKIERTWGSRVRPFEEDAVDPNSIKVHGYDAKEMKEFPEPGEVMKRLQSMMGEFVDKYDKNDKFVVAGYCVRFDIDFLRMFFEKLNDKYYGSWFFSVSYDVSCLVAENVFENGLRANDFTLKTMCDMFGIELKAHNAFADIQATRELSFELKKRLERRVRDVGIQGNLAN